MRATRMQLALYKGPPSTWSQQLFHRLVCWVTSSVYSHCELVIDGVCFSASGRDGGVRAKRIDLASERWDVLELPQFDARAASTAERWFDDHLSARYDWIGLAGFVLPWVPDQADRFFCSEAIAAALGLAEPRRHSPQSLMLACRLPDSPFPFDTRPASCP